MQDYFQKDCEYLLNQVIVMGEIGMQNSVIVMLIVILGLTSFNISVYAFKYLHRIRIGFFEIVDVAISGLAIVILYHVEYNLDPGPYSRQEKTTAELISNTE